MLNRAVQPLPTTPATSGESVSDGIVQTLWRRKAIVASAFGLSLIVGLFFVARAVPMYPSRARLMFDQTRTKILGTDSSAITDSFLHAQAELIRSRPIVDDAGATLRDKKLRALATTDVTGTIQSGLDVSVGKDDGILTVSYSTPNPDESMAIVDAVVNAYVVSEEKHHKSKTEEASASLLNQKHKRDEEAADLGKKIATFQSENKDVELPSSDRAIGGPKSHLSEAYEQAHVETITAESRYKDILASMPPPSVLTPADDDGDTDANVAVKELADAQATLDKQINDGLTDSNPRVVKTRSYITRLRQKLAAAENRQRAVALATAKSELESATRKQDALKSELDKQEAAGQQMRLKQQELLELTEQRKRAINSAQGLEDRIKGLQPDETAPTDVRILEPATRATHPDSSKTQKLAMAGLLGLLLGVGLSLLLDVVDQRLRSPEDARALLGLPVLGVIPNQPGNLSAAACGLIAHSDPMSEVAEAARSVRTAVYFASRTTPVKTILIASPTGGDGKSIFASNFAIAMAQAGGRTLLIDADFRNPAQEKIFDIHSGVGLSEVLAGRVPLDRAISRTPIEGLEVLPCGPVPRNPSEMLNGQGFAKLLETVSDRYQCIVLDSPAVLAVTDARILAAMADLTLFVVRTGQTPRKAADQGLDSLLSVGARVLGAVVNGVPTRRTTGRTRGGLRFVQSLQPINTRPGGVAALSMKETNRAEYPEVDVLD